MNISWAKVPSVSPGGRPWFLHAIIAIGDQKFNCVCVWNRTWQQWESIINSRVLGTYPTIQEAKSAIKKHIRL